MGSLGRVSDRRAPNLGKRGESVNLAARSAHDVLRANSAHKQGVSDERAMAAPGHRFSAHQGDLTLLSRLDRRFDALRKLLRLHVIRIAAKGGISPASVGRIAPGMAKAAKTWHVDIFQAELHDRSSQRILIELRIVSGTRHRAHIHDASCPVYPEQMDEFIDRARGMTDRQYERQKFLIRHASTSGVS